MAALPGARYLLRELLPRFVVLSFAFGFVVNFIPGLTFAGGVFAACTLSLVMTLHFMFVGSYLFACSPVVNFLERHKQAKWLMPAMIIFAFVEPALVLELVARLSFNAFAVDGVFAALLASLLVNICCFVTHDWGAGKADKQ